MKLLVNRTAWSESQFADKENRRIIKSTDEKTTIIYRKISAISSELFKMWDETNTQSSPTKKELEAYAEYISNAHTELINLSIDIDMLIGFE